jgi:hypothetical protein
MGRLLFRLLLELSEQRGLIKNNLFSDKDQAQIRIISIRQLRMLPPFHTEPINVVVYNDS